MRTTRIFLFFGSLLLGACAVTSIQKESTLEDIWKDRAADWRERLKHDEISILLLSGQIPMENNPKISELTKERYVRFISLLKILRDLDGHPFLKALVATQWMQRETRNGFSCHSVNIPRSRSSGKPIRLSIKIKPLWCNLRGNVL